ncbi:dihydroorotase [Shinella sp. DD12]|nr:dihydroorotase [Shinella sp. DD12]
MPGVETRLPILFSEGVSKGCIDLNQFVALSSTTHAKLYGLYPRKGTIAIGSDADIALWDPKNQSSSRTISFTTALTTHHMNGLR